MAFLNGTNAGNAGSAYVRHENGATEISTLGSLFDGSGSFRLEGIAEELREDKECYISNVE